MLIDSHCHVDFPELSERESEVLTTMDTHGVGQAICVGTRIEDFPRLRALVGRHPQYWASVGVHPSNAGCEEPDIAHLCELADDPKVVAIGETGLDYYWHKDAPEWQRTRFRTHIRAAKASGKPIIVHMRDSAADTLRILKEEDAGACGGVMHCFTESLEIAEAALALGLYISFSGIITFKNALALKAVAASVPPDRLLIETDAPYLAPAPHRGETNEPAWVRHVAEELALLHNTSFAAIEQATTENFFRLFRHAHSV
jgi:TatD DNase family protein